MARRPTRFTKRAHGRCPMLIDTSALMHLLDGGIGGLIARPLGPAHGDMPLGTATRDFLR